MQVPLGSLRHVTCHPSGSKVHLLRFKCLITEDINCTVECVPNELQYVMPQPPQFITCWTASVNSAVNHHLSQ